MNTRIRTEETISVLEVIQAGSSKQIVNFPSSNIADQHTDYQGPSPFHLNYCGSERCASGFQFGPSVRKSCLLHLVSAGKGTYRVNGKTYSLSAGHAFLIYPGDVTLYRADIKDPWEYSWIGFSGYQASFILSQMGFSKESHVIELPDMEPLISCIQKMLLTHQLTLANELTRESLLLEFFSLILRQIPESGTRPVHAKSTYARVTMQYLTNHFMDKILISDIADYIGVDRSYLGKCFQAEYQMSPQKYLLNLRMKRAGELLAHTDLSINEVAEQCGYHDALAFTKMFRKYNNCSPSQYRGR